ncbi:hypothetical protein ACGFNX_31820 [Streptomyces sp. NPDC048723]
MIRSPRSVSRLVVSMAVSAPRARSGSLSITRLPAPAWMVPG